MAGSKYFHLGDILSFMTGTIVCPFEEMTAPDGTVKPEWKTTLQPIIALAEHISGQTIWIDQATKEYDGYLLMDLLPQIRQNLGAQMPWLQSYNKNPPDAPQGIDKKTFYPQWVEQVAAANGGCWHKVQGNSLNPVSAPKPGGMSP